MGKLAEPKVYLVGHTMPNMKGLEAFLTETGNIAFLDDCLKAAHSGIDPMICLISFYAKLCYESLTVGHNANITQVRDIDGNFRSTIDQGHGSVWEHASLNFVITDCSRVFTHEMVRHRVGTAFSQTSGRYVRGDSVDIVFDPILEPIKEHVLALQHHTEVIYKQMVRDMKLDEMKDFAKKKKITSALRRLLPNGQSNKIGVTLNLRSLRYTIRKRTNAAAEWEIRHIFGQIYRIVRDMCPLFFYGMKEEIVDGLLQVSLEPGFEE